MLHMPWPSADRPVRLAPPHTPAPCSPASHPHADKRGRPHLVVLATHPHQRTHGQEVCMKKINKIQNTIIYSSPNRHIFQLKLPDLYPGVNSVILLQSHATPPALPNLVLQLNTSSSDTETLLVIECINEDKTEKKKVVDNLTTTTLSDTAFSTSLLGDQQEVVRSWHNHLDTNPSTMKANMIQLA